MKKYFMIFFLIYGVLGAQEYCTIFGRITEKGSDDGLPGANIVLDNSYLGTSAGVHGAYRLKGIKPGKHTLTISYLGYENRAITFELKAGEEKEINIELIPGALNMESVTVEAEKPFSAASMKRLRKLDIEIRPVETSQQLLKLVPGLVIAQHAGGGKAEQIYIRGFDCDHGTDINISVDGLPVNMVTHGHGQGYADLHFLIPEIVEDMSVYKGPYFASLGDFSTGGSIVFRTKDHVEKNLLKVEGGSFATARITGIFQIPVEDEHNNAYFAGQYFRSNGPFESPQNFERFNLYGKFHTHVSKNSILSVTASTFSSAWNASGQIPTRAVQSGIIPRFGAIDDMEGGNTSRTNFSLRYQSGEGTESRFSFQAWYSLYTFDLFSNFTFWAKDTVNGDMIEQYDNRSMYGVNFSYDFRKLWWNIPSKTTFGGGARIDQINVALWKSPDRQRLARYKDDFASLKNLFLWVEEELIFSRYWRLQAGLRHDYFTYDVDDKLDARDAGPVMPDIPRASGYAQKSMLNPKLNLVFSPTQKLDLFFNSGSSFHSNDARDVITAREMEEISQGMERKGYSKSEIDDSLRALNFNPDQRGIKTLPRAIGGEFGVRYRPASNFLLLFAAWGIDLEEELVFVGDEGTTEISGPTRRMGFDLETRFQFARWVWLTVDVNYSHGRFKDLPEGENYIPLAPIWTSVASLTMHHPSGWTTDLSYQYVGDRPANEDNSLTAIGYHMLNLYASYQLNGMKFYLYLENILNTEWNEAQFDTYSRLKNEPAPLHDVNYTPGNPFNIRLGMEYLF